VFGVVLLTCGLFAQQSSAADEITLLTDRATQNYDEMLKSRVIRALVVRKKTGYFRDGAQQRGATYDLLKLFEK
jgi:hypothetical protein